MKTCSAAKKDDGGESSSLMSPDAERKQCSAAAAAAAVDIDCAVDILLHSHFFFGSGLSLVNHEAAAFTRVMARHASTIANFWVHRRPLHMFYAGYAGDTEGYLTEAASHKGPRWIAEDSTDVFFLMPSYFHYKCLETSFDDQAVLSLGEDIQRWWTLKQQQREQAMMMSVDFKLPSGQIVDVERGTNDPVSNIGLSASLCVRGAVLREYLSHHGILRFIKTKRRRQDIKWWITITDDTDKYGEQELDISVNVYQSREAFMKDDQDQDDW